MKLDLFNMTGVIKAFAALFGVLGLAYVVFAYEPTQSKQIGYDGVAMQITDSDERLADRIEYNKVPPAPPLVKDGDLAINAYQNVQVLGHLTTAEFNRLMGSITAWVSPQQGCGYCHNLENLASDEVYTKVVSRRMLQMTQYINENWQRHVQDTGVTCWTCHRGQPVPRYIWFEQEPDDKAGMTLVGGSAMQNHPYKDGGLVSLPNTAFEEFLLGDTDIRIQSDKALPSGNKSSIKQGEWTYTLMMHFSRSLGVNCTYCHNSRSWADWSQSPVQRTTAWHGIRMVRQLNQEWFVPLTDTYPEKRLGPTGDGPKANCSTCHQGAYKPLLGVSMLPDFPSLAKAYAQPAKGTPAPATAAGSP